MRWPMIRNFPHHFSFNFVGLAPYAAILSVLLLGASGFSYFKQGLNLGVDFAGGTSFEVSTPGIVPQGPLRAALSQIGAHDPQVQPLNNGKSATVRFKPAEGVNAVTAAADVQKKLAAQFPGMTFKGGDTVGAKVSGE